MPSESLQAHGQPFTEQYALLEELRGAHPKRRHPVLAAEFTIGRDDLCTLKLPDERASRRHAQIKKRPYGYELEDLGSRNGTFLNGSPLNATARLRTGDRIRIGSHEFYFHDPRRVNTEAVEEEPAEPPSLRIGTSLKDVSSEQDRQALERLQRRMDGLLSWFRELAACHVESKVLEAALEGVFRFLPQAAHAFLAERIPSQERLVIRAARTAEGIRPAHEMANEVMARKALETREPVLTNDLVKDLRFEDIRTLSSEGPHSLLCTPLIDAGGHVHGVLQVESADGTPFVRPDLILLASLAPSIANALEACSLRERAARNAEREEEFETMRLARRGLMPIKPPALDGYEIFFHDEAARTLGGDFFEFLHVPQERLLAFVGKVDGPSLPAALLAARGSCEFRLAFQRNTDLARGLGNLNRLVTDRSVPGSTTRLLALDVDLASQKVTIGCAGSSFPWLKRGSDIAFLKNTVDDPPLGAKPGHAFTTASWAVEPEDVLVAFPEALVQVSNEEGRTLGVDSLRLALSVARGTAAEIGKALLGCVEAFAPGASRDALSWLLVLRRKG